MRPDPYLSDSVAYIYKLYTNIDDSFYYGSTTSYIDERFKQHIQDSKKSNRKVHIHFNKIGWENVKINCIEEFVYDYYSDILKKENDYIQQHIFNPSCLNMIHSYSSPKNKYQKYREKYLKNKDDTRHTIFINMLRYNIKNS